jgi:hypothetical protein
MGMGHGGDGGQGTWPPGGLLPAINARPAKDKYSNRQLVRSQGGKELERKKIALPVVTPYCCVAAAALRALIARKGTFMR